MTERGPGAARVGRWLFLVSLSVYLFTAGGSLTTTDAVVSFDVARNIVEHHTVAMSGNLLGMDAHRGRDGRYYSPFGLAQSLYDIPFYAAGRVARTAVGRLGKSDTVPKACVALGQTLLVALIVWEVFQLSMLLVGDRQAAALAALTCAFGSLLWPYARFGFSQPLACVTLVAAIRQAIAGVRTGSARRLAGSGAWLAASLLTRHEMGLAIAPVGLWVLAAGSTAFGSRLRRLLVFSPGVIAGVAIWLIYNASRFGNPLDTGFLRDPVPAFGSPIGAGLLGLLFSPSTSLFLYSPFAALGLVGLVALVRRDRSAGLLLTVLVAGFVLFYANLGNWLGGRSVRVPLPADRPSPARSGLRGRAGRARAAAAAPRLRARRRSRRARAIARCHGRLCQGQPGGRILAWRILHAGTAVGVGGLAARPQRRGARAPGTGQSGVRRRAPDAAGRRGASR